ncbi:MAG: hypothetical protein ACOYBE_01005 [Blautia sp.]|jgi:hypothetical protein
MKKVSFTKKLYRKLPKSVKKLHRRKKAVFSVYKNRKKLTVAAKGVLGVIGRRLS